MYIKLLHLYNFYVLTFKTVMIVRLENIPNRTFTVITPYCINTVVGTSSVVSDTLINICNNNESIRVLTCSAM